MNKSKKRFQFEQLEPRQMMAGDITAVLTGGSLYLTEAAGQTGKNNGVLISELANGKVHVQGTALTGTASKINGHASQDFTVTGSLFVNFGAGNDRVEFSAVGPVLNLQTIDLKLGPTSVKAGVSDNDTVSLANFQTTGGLSIYTGAGNDIITVNGGVVGNYKSSDQLWIKTGAGADYVSIQSTQIHGSLFVQTYDALSETAADTIYCDKNAVVAGNATFLLGSGNDTVFFGDSLDSQGYEYSLQVTGSMTLDTGAGDDAVSMYNPMIGEAATSQTTILLGAGRDHFTIDGQNAWLTNLNMLTYSLATEADADMVTILHANFGLTASIKMGGGDDEFLVTDPDAAPPSDDALVLSGPLLIDMGAGNDVVYIASLGSVTPTDTVTIRTGAGADTVNLLSSHDIGSVDIQTYDSLSETDADTVYIADVYFHNNLNVRMGGGNDQLTMLQSYAFGNISIDAGAGNDTANLNYVTAVDNLFANMGDGNDSLTMGLMWGGNVALFGGTGNDHLYKTGTWNFGSRFEYGWENLNGWLPLLDNVGGATTLASNVKAS
jgi:hypothetical protein